MWKRVTTFYGAEKSYTDLKCHHIKSISQIQEERLRVDTTHKPMN